MEFKDYLIDQVFKLVADKIYPAEGNRIKQIAETRPELEQKIKVLEIKQRVIQGKLEECDNRRICKEFISAYEQAAKDLKENSAYEPWKIKTEHLREIAADIADLYSYYGRKLIDKGLVLSLKIRELFSSGKIPAELYNYEEKKRTGQQYFDF
jgi:hypothetical protein